MRFETIKDLISSIETKQPQLDAMLIKEGDSYQNSTYKNLTDSVKQLANGLINMGIEKGDKIAIMAENRMEWSIVYLAVTTIGAIIIPISILWEPTELKTVAQNSGIKMFFTSEKYLDKIATIKKETLTLKQIVTFDAHPLTETNNNTPLTEQEYIPYPEIIQLGTDSLKQNIDHTQNITINPKDTAEILYVSCKIGVTLSHKAIMSNVEGLYKTLKLAKSPGKKLMMLIPFSHLYPTIFGILMTLRAQWTTVTAATARMDHILKIVKETAPHYIVLVPLLLERMYNRLNARIKKRNPTPEMLGTQNLEAVFVAGAKCPESFIEGLESLGLKVLEGYGLSEMAPFITMNTLEKNQTGSVGIPLENVVVKIANPDANGNGEVLAKGPNMMCGYHKLQQEGKLQIKAEGGAYIDEEGWLHTGDIGKLLNADGTTVTTPIADASHFLHITGRSRNIIVSRGGTNIYPKDIEEKLLRSKFIAKIKVVLKWDETAGEFPYAYILPDTQHLPKPWDTETNKTIDNELNNLSGSIAAYKIPRGFEITNEETLKNIEKQRLFMFEDF